MVPLSVLDLSPVSVTSTPRQAIVDSVALARLCDQLGYVRYWVAEHHGMANIATSAPEVLIAHLAGVTSRMRIGSGGIMLPNHCPLVVAEQFGTLESMYPGRIDLGLGRAPGTDPVTTHALRRRGTVEAERFPDDVAELQAYFRDPVPGQAVRAVVAPTTE